MYSNLVKEKYNTRPSEATEDTKKIKLSSEESEPQYRFQGQYEGSQHWFDIDPNSIEYIFMTREPGFSKVYTLKVFQVKPIRIGFIFCSNWR